MQTSAFPARPREHSETVARLIAFSDSWPLLSAAEEVALARAIERGCLRSKERLIHANVRLVIAVARSHQGRGLTLSDLVQEGTVGLIRACEKYDWRRGFRFSTYGTPWIRQSIQRALENTGSAIRIPTRTAQRARRVAVVERELTATLGRAPSEAEVAAAAELAPAALQAVREAKVTVTSLDRTVSDEGELTLGDLLVAPAAPLLEQLDGDRRAAALRAARTRLSTRERKVIELRFDQARTLSDAAAVLGVSGERVRQIEDAALRRLAADEQLAAVCA